MLQRYKKYITLIALCRIARSKHYALLRKSPSKVNSIQRCLTNRFQPMVRSAHSKRTKREDLTLESMAFRITLGSDARKMSLWKR